MTNNNQAFVENILNRMQMEDPNGEWVGEAYTYDLLEGMVTSTLYWHQNQYDDKKLQRMFIDSCIALGNYCRDEDTRRA